MQTHRARPTRRWRGTPLHVLLLVSLVCVFLSGLYPASARGHPDGSSSSSGFESGSQDGTNDVSIEVGDDDGSYPPPDDETETSPPPEGSTHAVVAPRWLLEAHGMALLTATNASNVTDGVLGLHLAPRFLVLPTQWHADSDTSELRWATFASSEQVRVRRVHTEQAFYAAFKGDVPKIPANDRVGHLLDEATWLTVVELDHAPEFATPSPLLVAPPREQVVYLYTEVAFYDLALKHCDRARFNCLDSAASTDDMAAAATLPSPVVHLHGFQFEDVAACALALLSPVRNGGQQRSLEADQEKEKEEEEETAFLCGASSEVYTHPVATSHEYTVGVMKHMFNAVVGFALEAAYDQYSGHGQVATLRLSTPHHRLFLDTVTETTITWEPSDLFAIEEQDEDKSFPHYLVQLYADATHDTWDVSRQCTGIVIAPTFVLTTASCLARVGGAFARMGYRMREGVEQLIPVDAAHQVPHPSYRSARDFLNDVAVIRLADPVARALPIVLDPGIAREPSQTTKFMVVHGGDVVTSLVPPSFALAPEEECDILLLDTDSDSEADPDPDVDVDFFATVNASETRSFARGYERGSSQLAPRGVCLRDERPQFRRTRPDCTVGNPLIRVSATHGASAVGLQVDDGSSSSSEDEDGGDMGILMGMDDMGVPPPSYHSGSKPSNVKLFLSFAENANFINAYARGHSWGKVADDMHGGAAPPSLPRFVVGLRITRDGQNFCGGSVVAPNYILTAAHCVTDGLVNWVSVGSRESAGLDTEPIQVVKTSIRVHPLYQQDRYSFDAAIIELSMPAYANPVVLDTSLDFTAHERATMYGYGVASADATELSPTVRVLDLPLLSRADCNALLPHVDGSMLCAGGEQGRDACTGDSGSPLVLAGESEDYLVGLVSAGYGCGLRNVPGLYARVSSLEQFIKSYVVGSRWRQGSSENSPSSGPPQPGESSAPTPFPTTTNSPDPDDIESYSRPPNRDDASWKGNNTHVGPSGASFEGAFQVTQLPSSLHSRLRTALMAFLVGDSFQSLAFASGSLQSLLDPWNEIFLYSTKSVAGVLKILEIHNKRPLYWRKDRFPRNERGERVKDAAATCE